MILWVMSVGFENLRKFWGTKCLQGCSKIYGQVFKTFRLSLDELRSCNGCSYGLPGRGDQFDSPWWLVFTSRFTTFALRSSGNIKYVILIEDSNTGSPSFCFWGGPGQKVSFLFLFLVLLKEIQMRGQSNPFTPLFSIFQEPSIITEVMKKIFKVNTNKDIEDVGLCDFTKDTLLAPAPPKNQRLHPPY